METQEILKLFPKLSVSERLIIVEAALELIHQEQTSLSLIEQKRQLRAAAIMAIDDYALDSELIVFSELDGEDFYDYRDNHT